MSSPQPPAPRGLLNWWQGLILAASSALIGVVAALFVLKPGGPNAPAGPGWATQLLRFIPHFLILFGILADAFTYEGVYWTGSAVGVFSSIVAPYVTEGCIRLIAAIKNRMQAKQEGGLIPGEYPGIEMLSMNSPAADTPETLVVTSSILAYYIFDLVTNLSVLDAAGAIVASMLLFGGQAFAIEGGPNKAALTGILGVVLGGICFGLINSMAPNYLPSSAIPGSKTAGGSGGAGGVGGPGRKGLGMSSGAGADPNMATAGGPASAATCPR